ncbi:hypothetical protein BABINDRAFT_160169 [Babjeviella inositovora NRRL Y-12698]|uniref:Non-specific serine/threonine protein kinase n=1 Tax=Babjeviella inositovora NRRL Y-12698 TaxID=984486 RepID=A0A1E3QXY8_9ASCO|nr:uncharacterized protein BABINDRAFT_160169 [Babjeviella inositovora NRRL Y-12698]ODQ81952.1 hypothetical protein BABINDRAFT_160169 [Babjeviella inositovora NRRL Y-12698]
MSYSSQLDAFVSRLQEDVDCKTKHSILSELLDMIETFSGSTEYEYFLKSLMPIFIEYLDTVPISFSAQSPEHKLRNTVLEIVHRSVMNETFQPYALPILEVLQRILRDENEDNGVLCIKIITSLHKAYKGVLVDNVQAFIDLIIEIYTNIAPLVAETFAATENMDEKPLNRAMASFKTVAECPITMVSLYSSYKPLVNTCLPVFIPHVIDILTLEAAPQAAARTVAEARGERLTSVAAGIANRAAFGDFVLGQVKAASFLAYIFIRGYAPVFLKPYHKTIPDLIMRILQDCPSELSGARKELLHSTRHILLTPFRSMFLPKCDLLFDERVLVGDGLTAHDTLRPLAYSTVADFIHNVRAELTAEQIFQTVQMFCRILQDDTLALTVQIMSSKLLLNLVESIMKLPEKGESRQLFMQIIDAHSKRFVTLNRKYDEVMWGKREFERKRKVVEKRKEAFAARGETPSISAGVADADGDIKMEDENTDNLAPSEETVGDSDPSVASDYVLISVTPPSTSDPLKDACYLFRSLMSFLKSVIFGLKSCNPPPPTPDYNLETWNTSAKIFTYEEINILRSLFREGILGLRFFQTPKPEARPASFDIAGPNIPVTSSKEENEIMEIFATMFIHIDSATFNEIVHFEMPFLYAAMLENLALLHIPQFFLANEITSQNFLGLLTLFAKSKLAELGEVDVVKLNILIRLFKLCFMSVNLFPTVNEAVILPHLNDLILQSLQLTTTAKQPMVYFYLIRTLFRSIGGGRFEHLYKEIMPLLQVLLETLNRMIQTARHPQERDIYVELCLTVPVRLSVLVPHLSYLMRPLVFALNGSQELVSQGLRTLELCVDNLTAEYFDPIIEPVIEEVMEALWKHLKPLPYYHQHSHTTFRVLGKLGGRNRRFVKPAQNLRSQTALDQEVEAFFKIDGLPEEAPVSITSGITAALTLLEDPRLKIHYRVSAFQYLSGVLKLFVDAEAMGDGFEHQIAACARVLAAQSETATDSADAPAALEEGIVVDKAKLTRQQALFLRLLEAMFYAVSIPEVADAAQTLLAGLYTHATLLYIGKFLVQKRKNDRPFSTADHEGRVFIDERVFVDAIVDALSFYVKEVRSAGVDAIKTVFRVSAAVFASATQFPLLRFVFNTFVHTCYDEAYYRKLGGTVGLQTLIEDLDVPVSWFAPRQFECTRALFFVLRDSPSDAPHEVRATARRLIYKLLRECNRDLPAAEAAEKPFQTFVASLVYDLGNANLEVRETAQEALRILATTTNIPLAKLIEPSKNVLLTPIFGKPLRALPFPMQIGNLDAITFCLGLENTFLQFNEELNRLLIEALTLVDAEDESLTSANRVFEYRTSEQLVKLRVACIRLLSLALNNAEFVASRGGQTRIKILAVFFKTLCAKSSEVINASHMGLKLVLSQNAKVPKELLQSGLRPMLMNLLDHKKLTVPGLEALARLLELLISYFKVEIGRKLLDHLMAWAQPATLHQISAQELDSNPTVQIIVAILNIFHLLPPKAFTFMDEIMNTLQYLEEHLHRRQTSPFRAPVAKFLNRFAPETFQYFALKFGVRQTGTRCAYFVGLEACAQLRAHVKQNLDKLYDALAAQTAPEVKCVMFANLVDVIRAIAPYDAAWLCAQRPMLAQLADVMKDVLAIGAQAPFISPVHFQVSQAVEQLQVVFVETQAQTKPETAEPSKALEDADVKMEDAAKPEDSEALVVKPDAVEAPLVLDTATAVSSVVSFLDILCTLGLPLSHTFEDFLHSEVIQSDDVSLRQTFLAQCVAFATASSSLPTKIFLFKHLVNPILMSECRRHGSLDRLVAKRDGKIPAWLELVHAKVWKSSSDIITVPTAGGVDSYRFELLQMTAICIKWAPAVVGELRKDVIKFSWNYIRLDDNITKQTAYVVTSYFIAAYDTPVKIVTQVFVALLRAHQADTRYLVKQALDLLAPAMPSRMAQGSPVSWLKWPRRVLSEDGFTVTQVLNVYQFIVQHPDLFYVARDQFIPNVITAMGKLTILANPSVENQVLAIDLAEMILRWEERARAEREATRGQATESHEDTREDSNSVAHVDSRARTERRESDSLTPRASRSERATSPDTTPTSYTIPYGLREACITFLVRYVCLSQTRASESDLGQRALTTLHQLLGPVYWSDVVVKLQFFDKFLVSADFSNTSMLGFCLNALEVLAVTLEWQTAAWIVEHLTQLETLLDKCLRSDNHDVQEVLQRVLRIILEAINEHQKTQEEESEEIRAFLTSLTTIVQDDLGGMSSVAAGVTICWTLATHSPASLDLLLQPIMRTFRKLFNDHIAISHGAEAPTSEYEAKMTTKLLEKILNLSLMRILNLGDQRRVFLTLLAQLIERSLDKDLLHKIIAIVRGWVFSKTDLFPTTKEKAGILQKMMVFEARGEMELAREYYSIVTDIFEDKTLSCTELTVRMEHPFLVGTHLSDVKVRERLVAILNDSLERDIAKRLYYIVREQSWEAISNYPWTNQALQLLFGSFDGEYKLRLVDGEYRLAGLSNITEGLVESTAEEGTEGLPADASTESGGVTGELVPGQALSKILGSHQAFLTSLRTLSAGDLLAPLIGIFYQSAETIHAAWVNLFPVAYSAIPPDDKMAFSRSLVGLLSKDYHTRQMDSRPNVIQSLLEGVGRCDLQLPPHLVKYLGSTYDAWYPAIRLLEAVDATEANAKVRDANQDALVEMYATLQEDDMFYGLWRRRAKYFETNAALLFEQLGLWDKALQLYEAAQIKARSGALPYGEAEYALWEDNWIVCAEKLQHWDVLTELAKHEGFTDLLLECGWRVADWTADKEPLEQSVKTVMDVPTPRRQVFETFLCLQGYSQQKETIQELSKYCDEGIQLALRKWHALPLRFTQAHVPLLHTFQQYVEFMEASQVYGSLLTTTAQNLDVKSQELKRVLQAWRERLPNVWDDINCWNDLVTWRQHAFGVINRTYVPFIPAIQQANGNATANSYAYRGYHEIAWVINRFAHVARTHNMPEVCINQLAKIYTLPNIEIQEAFLKLREQAKCHYQNMNELNTGLDVISNTNLVYFGTQQKAEFFTLKGMFLAKLKVQDEANQAFALAVQIDLNLPKAWAEWGLFNDRRFKENPADIVYANNAISCYLQASGLYKNGKTRKLLSRILWLLSLDDAGKTLTQAFDNYRGEVPVWYWITFIPQLLTSLSHKEASLVRLILIRIAKSYPQALHFQLRTTKEDFAVIQRQAAAYTSANTGAANPGAASPAAANSGAANPAATNSGAANLGGEITANGNAINAGGNASAGNANAGNANAGNTNAGSNGSAPGASLGRQPWEHVDEIMGILKTAYPLLALSLESLVDQISQRFKCNADEDAYRLVIALLNDGVQYLNRLPNPRDDIPLPQATEQNITRFAGTVLPKHIRAEFQRDLIDSKPNLETYIRKLRKWRDRLEAKLDRRFGSVNLETLCPHLSEFHYQKFEDIEIPGQYLMNKDNNNHFIKIERFLSTLDLVRGPNSCYKRMRIRGHDGSVHAFAVQFPAARHLRREERIFQLFRIFNDGLAKKVQSRRRNIQLTLPVAVPLSPHIRILTDNAHDVSMHAVYEQFCRARGQNRDEPFVYTVQKLRAAYDPRLPKPDVMSIRVEILSAVQSLLVPSTVLKNHFTALYPQYEDFWLFRKQFTSQYASFIFMTYMMCINGRQPQKIHIDAGSGNIWTSDMLPSKVPSGRVSTTAYASSNMDVSTQRAAPVFHNGEPVPFRLTPNVQKLIGESGLEGILSTYILTIANCLSEPEYDMEQYMSLFVRDEVISWFTQQHRPSAQDPQLREIVRVNVDFIVKKTASLGHVSSGNSVATQYVLELISQAVNPRNLAGADSLWMAYL